jgi:hypothetical protein
VSKPLRKKVANNHHNNLVTNTTKTSWSCHSDEPAHHAWLHTSGFAPTPFKFVDRFRRKHISREELKPFQVDPKRRPRKEEIKPASARRRMTLTATKNWSGHSSLTSEKISEKLRLMPESKSIATMDFTARGWMIKKNLPSIIIPTPMKKQLIVMFNEHPHVSPDGARLRLLAMGACRNDVFVTCIMTPMRVKGHFGSLLAFKTKNKLGTAEATPLAAAGTESTDVVCGSMTTKVQFATEMEGSLSQYRQK